jgi:hypothetical protein
MPKKDTKKKITKPKVVKLKKKSAPKKAAPKKTIQTQFTPTPQFTNTYVNIQTENLPPVYYTMPTTVPTFKMSNTIGTNTEIEPVRYFETTGTNTEPKTVQNFATNTEAKTVQNFATNTERKNVQSFGTNTEPEIIPGAVPIRVNLKRTRPTIEVSTDEELRPSKIVRITPNLKRKRPIELRRERPTKKKRTKTADNIGIELTPYTDPSSFSFENPMRRQY